MTDYNEHINEFIDFFTKINFFDEGLTSCLKPFTAKAIQICEAREQNKPLITFNPEDQEVAVELLQVVQEKILYSARIQEDMIPLRKALEFLYNIFMMADHKIFIKFTQNLSSLLDSRDSLQADILRLRDVVSQLKSSLPTTSLLESDVSREYLKLVRESFSDFSTEDRRLPKAQAIEKKLQE